MAERRSWKLSAVPITIGLLSTLGIPTGAFTAGLAVWVAVGVVTLAAVAVHSEDETAWLEQSTVKEVRPSYSVRGRTASISPGRRV